MISRKHRRYQGDDESGSGFSNDSCFFVGGSNPTYPLGYNGGISGADRVLLGEVSAAHVGCALWLLHPRDAF